MEYSDFISVIIPAHNAENTLEKCCKSIVDGSYKNIEVLIIENCSTDQTLEVANELEKSYSCVKVFTTKEKGVSNARNIGLKNSKGKYIAFVDSDDFVTNDYLTFLHKKMVESNAELVCASVTKASDVVRSEQVKSLKNIKIVESFLNEEITGYSFAKLFLKEVIETNHLSFPIEMSIGEDRNFVFRYLLCIQTAIYSDHQIYYYVQNPLSVLNQTYDKRRFDLVKESLFEMNSVTDMGHNLREKATQNAIRSHLRYMIIAAKKSVLEEVQFNEIRSFLRHHLNYFVRGFIPLRWKIYWMTAVVTPYHMYLAIINNISHER